ncbi:hypothetical protein AB0B13_37195 [Streptomyces sp. NPDC042898]
MSTANARLGSRAGCNPRTTASPVTTPLTAPTSLRLSERQSAKLTRSAPQ